MTFFNFNLSSVNSLECVSMNNQECKIRTEIINLNTYEPMFYQTQNLKVFNLMSRNNEIRHKMA